MKITIATLTLALFVSGCVKLATQEQLNRQLYGQSYVAPTESDDDDDVTEITFRADGAVCVPKDMGRLLQRRKAGRALLRRYCKSMGIHGYTMFTRSGRGLLRDERTYQIYDLSESVFRDKPRNCFKSRIRLTPSTVSNQEYEQRLQAKKDGMERIRQRLRR